MQKHDATWMPFLHILLIIFKQDSREPCEVPYSVAHVTAVFINSDDDFTGPFVDFPHHLVSKLLQDKCDAGELHDFNPGKKESTQEKKNGPNC